jgi:hypothetical protein
MTIEGESIFPIEDQTGQEGESKEQIMYIHNLATRARAAIEGNLEGLSEKNIKALRAVDELEKLALDRFPEIREYEQQRAA